MGECLTEKSGRINLGLEGVLVLSAMAAFGGAYLSGSAWVGVLATALNLLPIGQLDGGHILYAFIGERTKALTWIFLGALLALSGYQMVTTHYHSGYNWLFWAVVLFLVARKHPQIYDPRPLSPVRRWLGYVALLILILSFTPNPVRT